MGARFIDEIEQCGEELAKDVFHSETADLRSLSGHTLDLIFLACFTNPKDTCYVFHHLTEDTLDSGGRSTEIPKTYNV